MIKNLFRSKSSHTTVTRRTVANANGALTTNTLVRPSTLQEAMSKEREQFLEFLVSTKADQYLLCAEEITKFQAEYGNWSPEERVLNAQRVKNLYFASQTTFGHKQGNYIFLKPIRYGLIDIINKGNITANIFDDLLEDLLEELEFEHLQRFNLAKKKKQQSF
eukprot:TRINITY_DN2488_c0_g1_i1.p1 TRINITY_DN2488_c0_g1~~TRINITY_DN2488_c0_g1_i1.p1  ORF type:complete len:163 (+),score=33.17 TRINITY_DN2488_c0_g1_i1:58-546(+)